MLYLFVLHAIKIILGESFVFLLSLLFLPYLPACLTFFMNVCCLLWFIRSFLCCIEHISITCSRYFRNLWNIKCVHISIWCHSSYLYVAICMYLINDELIVVILFLIGYCTWLDSLAWECYACWHNMHGGYKYILPWRTGKQGVSVNIYCTCQRS